MALIVLSTWDICDTSYMYTTYCRVLGHEILGLFVYYSRLVSVMNPNE